VTGIPALVIIECAEGLVARVERSRWLAALTALYALAALLASGFLAPTQEGMPLWWPAHS
jgi:hypothetical protein